jgi:hypothetical protein
MKKEKKTNVTKVTKTAYVRREKDETVRYTRTHEQTNTYTHKHTHT